METPPRAWGRLRILVNNAAVDGNTPTCVAKTPRYVCVAVLREKHPHVRGEDARLAPSQPSRLETPPRAWGRQIADMLEKVKGGNTPTCVGKTVHLLVDLLVTKKHPHVRGEDRFAALKRRGHSETPPRAWGRPGGGLPLVQVDGNTPTCVGKTFLALSRMRSRRKHPHVRGED